MVLEELIQIAEELEEAEEALSLRLSTAHSDIPYNEFWEWKAQQLMRTWRHGKMCIYLYQYTFEQRR